jgi:hypothetical protein
VDVWHGNEAEKDKDKKHCDSVFRGWDHIHNATKQLSIRKPLRRSTAMYVYTGELLGQPLSRSMSPCAACPDWVRSYLKDVREGSRKTLAPYVSLFETITFHPFPLLSNPSLGKVIERLLNEDVNTANMFGSVFLLELRGIRDSRLQNKNFAQLHANHRKLFQDVVTRFKTFEPKDLEPILIDALLLPFPPPDRTAQSRGMPIWNLGKRFVQEKLPKGLSTRVTKSAWYMQDAIFVRLGGDLQSMAVKHQTANDNFRKKVEIERKARAKRS